MLNPYFYQVVYDAVLDQELRRLDPLTTKELERGLQVGPLTGSFITNHPEIFKAIEDARREALHQRRLW